MTRQRPRLAGLVVAAFVAATGSVALQASPAAATQCTATSGVSIVVDYSHGAGGGLDTGCDADGGGQSAATVFQTTGFPLGRVHNSPGFVCTVRSRPSGNVCGQISPASAYWGLFWAKAGATSWTYASRGADALTVPSGGAVAFAFQDGGGTDYPGQAPSTRSKPKPTPKPTPKPKPTIKPKPTKAGSAAASAPAPAQASAQATAQPRASGSAKASPSTSASSSASSSDSASVAPPTESDDVSPEPEAAAGNDTELTSGESGSGSGLPLWVPGALVVVLGVATGGVLWRRRSGGRSEA